MPTAPRGDGSSARSLSSALDERTGRPVREVAKATLGFGDLRPGQVEAVEALLSGRGPLVVMPIGPPASRPLPRRGSHRWDSVVVSPLIAHSSPSPLSPRRARPPRVYVNAGSSTPASLVRFRSSARSRSERRRAPRRHVDLSLPRAPDGVPHAIGDGHERSHRHVAGCAVGTMWVWMSGGKRLRRLHRSTHRHQLVVAV